MPTNAELTQQLTEMTKRATDAETRIGQLSKDLEQLGIKAEGSAKTVAEYGKQIDTLGEDLRSTRAQLKAYKGSATKARGEAAVLRKQVSPDSRKIGALRPPKNDDEADQRREALEAAFAADTTEVVFSDGSREIRELAPLMVTSDAWRQLPHWRILNHEPLLEPGDCQRQEMTVRGIALLNEAGDQVGWCPHDPIVIQRNQRFQLPLNSIRF